MVFVEESARHVFILDWHQLDAQAVSCWADDEFATEQGAYAIACLLVEKLTDWVVIERSWKGTGFDYWLGERSSEETLFQKRARLEVSGIRTGDLQKVQQRVRRKLRQIERSAGLFPGLVIVVEFSQPLAVIASR